MGSRDLLLAIFILIIFAILFTYNFLGIEMEKIKENWPVYRCNPMIMPFARQFGHDPGENFMYCIQNIQGNFMSVFLAPLVYALQLVATITKQIVSSLAAVRTFIAMIREKISAIISSIFGMFGSIGLYVVKLIFVFKDILSKIFAIIVDAFYMMKTSVKMIEAVISQPFFSEMCFHPKTKLKLKNGVVKKMKDINLGDVLEGDIHVRAVLKISNIDEKGNYISKLYKIKHGVDGEDIFVTGSHKIYDKEQGKFINVENYVGAELTKKKIKQYSCLITDNHKIPIANHIFWDWEDNLL